MEEDSGIPLEDLISIMLRESKEKKGACRPRRASDAYVTAKEAEKIKGIQFPLEFHEEALVFRYRQHTCHCGNSWTEEEGIFLKRRSRMGHTVSHLRIEENCIELYFALPRLRHCTELIVKTCCLRCFTSEEE